MYGGLIGTHQRSCEWYNPRPPMASPSSRLGVCNSATHLIAGTGKATDFKFGGYIYRANPNKSPLIILEKRERGRIQGLPAAQFFGYPYSATYKATDFKFCRNIRRSIRTKAHENVGNSSGVRVHSQGVPKIFRAPMYRAHLSLTFCALYKFAYYLLTSEVLLL